MVVITPPPLSEQSMADLASTIMVLCQGKHEDGGKFWAYLCLKPSMAKDFHDARENGCFPLEEFGTVIEWGEGETVPVGVRERMERDYGMNHNYEAELVKALETIE